MKKIDIRDWTHEQWLDYRKTGIGGSDAAAIVGLNPYCSAYQVYLNKTGQIPETEDNEAMRQGRDLEAYVASRFEEATGKKVQRCNYILRSEEHPFMFANVDRLVVGEKAILECKTTSVLNRSDFASGDIPPNYYCQCQHYMAVTGYNLVYLAVLVLNKGFHVFEIKRNEDDIKALVNAEKDFWENNVLAQKEPAPDGSLKAAEILKKMYPEGDDDVTVDLFGFEKKLDRLKDIQELSRTLKTEADRITQEIQATMGAATVGYCGEYTVNWKNITSYRINTGQLKEQYPEVYSECLNPTSYRKFSFK